MSSATLPQLLLAVEPPAARRLLEAATELFSSAGYQATTTRDIAERAGMSPAAVYVHFDSKGELLLRISQIGHGAALEAFERGLSASADPVERVRNAVAEFAAWHAENQELARVVQYELEHLPGDGRNEIRALRAHFEELLRTNLEAGVQSRRFQIDDIPGTATAIFSLCIDVARWYSPRADRTPETIGALYANLSLRMIEARPSGNRRPARIRALPEP